MEISRTLRISDEEAHDTIIAAALEIAMGLDRFAILGWAK